ncbi:hypothetical protein K504DRAFT_463283 [Pleomassaria siparia CBS 279.74]|uniref:Uncharacterized protein n=1 Tax=Pleomassaria siparia CBS 279.74 TaxID=1314801 RepID=A0A6G1JTA6_9PLEO|nr:hypothetical protein K504DRAFT_463283 [Pleomassaria siparia CBS 279.74]
MLPGARSTNSGWLQEGVIRGSMLGKTILPSDEERGKKDDDHKRRSTTGMPAWSFLKKPMRWRRRRILLAVVGMYLIYLLIHNMSDTIDALAGPDRTIVPLVENIEHHDPPPGTTGPSDGGPPSHTYTGPIKLYKLSTSLHGSSHTQGFHPVNQNVLFAISSLRSAATLLPMICEMSRWNRNWVHAAFMGREDIPIEDLLEINGVDKEKCPVKWHDARPDYMEYSTDARAESAVMAAMMHIQTFIHPQVVIMDDSLTEDVFFTKAMRAKTRALDISLIEIPQDRWQNLMWMTRLDAGSLKSWHQPTVDVLIQVPPGASGGLMRLLKSIKEADYSGSNPPRLTIELPADIDSSVKRYLENFKWPANQNSPLAPNQLTIRRRVTNQRITQEESAIRFLELFYPTSTSNSHVLILSPQAELSPIYYHYLKHALLEYKYSFFGENDSANNIMGISLELPSVLLDGKTKLTLPKLADMHTARYKKLFPNTRSAQFLWQAPNSHATLFFADKWAELHSFLGNRVAKQHQTPKAVPRRKLVSETLPSWTEYLLELMRARGYSLYYPGTTASSSFVTMHNELFNAPGEFLPSPPADSDHGAEPRPKILDEPFLRGEDTTPSPQKHIESPVIPASWPLHLALPFDGDLPEIPHLAHLLYNGEIVHPLNVTGIASIYANSFREVVGGCKIPPGKQRVVESENTKDLFCFGDEDEDDWEEETVLSKMADVEKESVGSVDDMNSRSISG